MSYLDDDHGKVTNPPGPVTSFHPNDKVRVTLDATYSAVAGSYWFGDKLTNVATVELIQAADDPSKDPVGTVRENKGSYEGTYALLPTVDGKETWLHTTVGFRVDHKDSTLGPVVGVVPGTPAAEAQDPREPWTGDGSEEPPAHVLKVRDNDGDTLVRKDDGWAGDGSVPNNWSAVVFPWQQRAYGDGPYTEVLPE